MEHQNSTAYKAATAALARGDLAGFLASVEEDVHWWELGAKQPIVGRSALEEHLSRKTEATVDQELHDVLANDEHLVALIHATAVRESQTIDVSFAEVIHYNKRGLVIKRQAFPSNVWTALELLEVKSAT